MEIRGSRERISSIACFTNPFLSLISSYSVPFKPLDNLSDIHTTHTALTEKVRTQYPVEISHTLIVLSLEADTINIPSGENVTEDTLWSWPESI